MYSPVSQPSGGLNPMGPGMMMTPHQTEDCPPGLEYLTVIDQVFVSQDVDAAKVAFGCVNDSRFSIMNSRGENVFYATEDNNWCNRNYCRSFRSFLITVTDVLGQEVMTVTRPMQCRTCCFPFCLQELEVQSPPGNPIGYVVQDWHLYLPKFTVLNERMEPVLTIMGPFCTVSCCSEVNFEIKTLDDTAAIGTIAKQWAGLAQEIFTDADNFCIKFPLDLDVKMKAVMLGACLLINFMYFEQ